MKNLKKILVIIALFNLSLLTISVSAQIGGRPVKPTVKLPALLMPDPKIEWGKYEENVKRGNKMMKAAITFSVINWEKYDEILFKPLDIKTTCSDAETDSRMILEMYDFQTDKSVYTDCAVDADRLKTNTLYILPENKIPVCVYAVLTDRLTNRVVKSNWMDVKGGKNCIKSQNFAPEEPKGSVTVVTPKKP